ncbi:MAG: metal-dependent transcriptional regulator [Anaerolineaceae bacterium]|nr:metal-dependent transcriptional regulator [Anaerolineaceae bacterium]
MSDHSIDSRPTATIEDYLWVIYVLNRDGESVIGARLAEILEVSPPTVTVTLKRMVRDGWINMGDKKKILLTEDGLRAARLVLRRHMLVEMLLADMLKVPWGKLHDEAHKLEHYISDEVENHLIQQLGMPSLCPHGNPIPGNEDLVSDWQPLIEIAPGSRVIVRRIHELAEGDMVFLDFLESNGLLIDTEAILMDVLPSNGTVSLQIKDQIVTLGLSRAKLIYAQVI